MSVCGESRGMKMSVSVCVGERDVCAGVGVSIYLSVCMIVSVSVHVFACYFSVCGLA